MPRRHFQWIALMFLVSLLLNGSSNRYAKSFNFLLGEVSHRALAPVSQRELLDGGLDGMLRVCDPHSMFIPPKQYADLNEALYQEFGGIGVITYRDAEADELRVGCCFPNSPASAAGLLPGDVIRIVDGKSAKGWTPEKFAESVRGPLNTSTHLGILRTSSGQTLALVIPRERIAMESVCGDVRKSDGTWLYFLPPLPGVPAEEAKKVAYLQVTTFGERTAVEMRTLLETLKSEGMDALVLDLRHNPGGFFDVVVQICDMFVGSGVLVSTSRRDPEADQVFFHAKPDVLCPGIPIAVLIDSETASASEVLAACLQDHGEAGELQAVCVGTRTYGKGAIQEVIDVGPLPDDRQLENAEEDATGLWKRICQRPARGGLKITVAQYRRPNGLKIHRYPKDTPQDVWGVTPNPGMDVEFHWTEDVYNFHQKRVNGSMESAQYGRIYEFDPPLERAVTWFYSL